VKVIGQHFEFSSQLNGRDLLACFFLLIFFLLTPRSPPKKKNKQNKTAIMSYKSLPLKKEVKKLIHLVLHAIAIILGCVGIAAAFKNHNESNIANLYSLHSWLGITIISLYGIQVNPSF
jgi:cytochrome b561